MQEQDFAAKRNALFACLDDASKEIKGTILDQGDAMRYSLVIKRHKNDADGHRNFSYMRGKESIFKKPELPITRCLKARKTPDYQVNPHKWKKYSLSDVDISDHTNTAAAFSFLKKMDEQREEFADAADDDDDEQQRPTTSHKIEFKKSSKLGRNLRHLAENELADAEVDKPKLKGSKLVMPEYVVGQKKAARKRKQLEKAKSEKTRAAGSLKLSHLEDELDGNDSNEDDDAFMAER